MHLHSVEEEARGRENCGSSTIMKELRLPARNSSSGPKWPPYRPLDPAMIAPMPGGDPRLYTNRWWEVHREQEHALRERREREEARREAKALKNYHGPRWWESKRA